ncbi:MAG TPA: hypothetical protein VIG49_14425 [Acetobacteraceae bacterium]
MNDIGQGRRIPGSATRGLCRLAFIALLAGVPAAYAADAQSALKPGPGLDVVETSCSICHTTDYIRMNSPFLTPAAWKAEVDKMRSAYGAPIDDDAAAEIVKYLSAHYAVAAKQ